MSIPLPALPQHHSEDWWTDASDPPCKFLANRLYTDRQLRTRDFEIIRVALEAAAKVLTEYRISVGNSAAGEIACSMTYAALKECRDNIRALEFTHHE